MIGHIDFTLCASSEAGYIVPEPIGDVYGVYSLGLPGTGVLYTAEYSCGLLKPAPTGFGCTVKLQLECYGPMAGVGTPGSALFLDSSKTLWACTVDGFELLGYTEALSSLTGQVVLTYNAAKELVFISDAAQYFVYSPRFNALTGPFAGYIQVTNAGNLGNQKELVGKPLFTTATDKLASFGWHMTLSAGLIGRAEELIGRGLYRTAPSGPWAYGPWRTASPEGVVPIRVSGIESRVQLSATTMTVEALEIQWQNSDRRYRRGLNAVNQT
jgi:hypothetical protein